MLSFSAIADDPRVRRHCQALHDAGHRVVAYGLTGAASPAPDWTIREVPVPDFDAPAKVLLALRLSLRRVLPGLALRLYWLQESHRRLYQAARATGFDLYIANDWPTLPIAARLAAESGAAYLYDSHEYAAVEHLEDWRWRLLFPGYVRTLEGAFIGGAANVVTVCGSIAEHLRKDYGLGRAPIVLRNLPPYTASPFRPTGERVSVLYHGLFNRNRGLDTLVRSLPFWRPALHLTLRGTGQAAYLRELARLAEELGVADRLTIEPPVPADQVVEAANAADIGIFALPDSSPQNRNALPNKLFEYVMAGLYPCVTALPEMAAVVERYGLGPTIPDSEPQAIAAVLNDLDASDVDRFKRRAIEAARDLCWEREQPAWLAAVEQALSRSGSCAVSGPRSA